MKKKNLVEKETDEQKKERWKKLEKMARSFAKQAGIKNKQKKKDQSEKYDY